MKRTILFLMMTFLFARSSAQGQVVSKNLSLAGLVGYQTLYGNQSIDPTQSETLTDLATWRDSRDGKEYALVGLPTAGSGSGVAMVDVTNPTSPFRVKTIRRPGTDATNTPADVKVYNNFLFVAQNAQPTYWVDLTMAVDYPGNPTAGYKNDITTGINIHNLFVNKEQQLLFLSYFTDNQKIQVYDISGVPNTAPVFKGEVPQVISGARSHDLYARKFGADSGRVYDASLRSITVSSYRWVNGTFTVGAKVAHKYNPRRGINPSDFSNPTKIIPENKRLVHTTWLGAGNTYLFGTNEQYGGSNDFPNTWINPDTVHDYQRGNYLYVWDINNIYGSADHNGFRYPIEQVYEVRETSDNGAFASPPNAFFTELSNEKANSIHNLASRGTTAADTLYAAYYTKGIRVLNITNPTSMSEIAYYDTPGLGTYRYPVYNGPWGVDPFLPSENILASSADGLYVFRKTGVFSGTISVNTRWTNQITVVGNVTVAAGVTLTVDPGTTVKFASGTSLTINGTLDVNGTSGQLVTFTGTTATPGFWGGIKFNSGGYGNIDYAVIEYATRGVDLNSTSLNMYFSEIKYCTYGIYASNSTIYDVQDNLIRYNTYYGIYLYATYAELMGNDVVDNSDRGIYLTTNSSGDITYGEIKNNGTNVEGRYSSNPYIENNSIGAYLDDYTMKVVSNCFFHAEYNVWLEGCPTSSDFFIGTGCTIDISPPCSPLSKVAAITLPAEGDALTGYDPNLSIMDNLRNARKLLRSGEYQAAKEITQHIITTFPDSAVTVHALNLLGIASRKEGTLAAFTDVLEDLSAQKKKTDLIAHAEFLLAKFDDKDRIAKLDKIIHKYPGMVIVEMALLDQFMYYLNEVDAIEKAREIANKIDEQFPDSELAFEVHRQLGDVGRQPKSAKAQQEKSPVPVVSELSQNYPNPFNPETNIRYGLSTTTEVSLEIYNLRGEKVASLVQATQPAGKYNVIWDGRDSAGRTMASGVYLCRMRAGSFVQTRKLMLLK